LKNTYTEFLEDGQRFEIFEDHFKDNSSDWELMQNATHEVKIADGHLVLNALTKEGTSRYTYLKFNKEDFIIETKIEFSRNKKEDQGGLIYGFKDWNNYNFFYINQENLFIGTVYEGVRSYSIDDMFSSAINEKGANTLKIISNGGDVLFTINGNAVYKSSKYNFYGNHVGVALLGKFTMKVDLIRFKQISYSAMGHGSIAKGQQNADVKSSGTGFFIHPSGIIATNFHVIENEKQIIVDVLDTASSAYVSYKATVLMKDMENDLALLKITDNAFKPLFDSIYYSFHNSHSFELGSNAFTLGFPLALAGMGASEAKFSDGKISAKTGYNGALNSFQTTIPVQPGNSGGPVFNESGELIGIINSKISKADNVSYCIKQNFLINLVQSLPENIELTSQHHQKSSNLEEIIRQMKKYIVFVKIK
jgi:S1-C subfamily serine protease